MRILGLLVLAGAVDAAAATGTITQLSHGSADEQQNMPAISGTNVVWTESLVSPTGSNFDIYYFDINNPSAGLNLTQTPGDQEFLEDIDGNFVVWTHTSARIPGDIVVYDLVNNTLSNIAGSTSSVHFEQPAIRGNYVTFLRVGAQTDVYLYDLAIGAGQLVTNDPAAQGRPRVGGGHVVFEDYRAGGSDIYGSQIPVAGMSFGAPFAIATGPDQQITPDVDGNTVVYVRTMSGHDQIFAYDLRTGTTTQLTNSASFKVLPRISGSRIVWSDDRAGNLDLYFYDLAAKKEEPLVTGAGDQFLSDIDGDRVVYTDNSSGFEQVYLFTFDGQAPPAPSLPEGCDPGKTQKVGNSVVMHRVGGRPVYAGGSFTAQAGKTYWVCVENGIADGSQKTAQFSFELDGEQVLNPSDFKPNANPPRWVAAKLPTDNQCKRGQSQHKSGHDCGCDDEEHDWEAALFGRMPPNHVSVTIRVSK